MVTLQSSNTSKTNKLMWKNTLILTNFKYELGIFRLIYYRKSQYGLYCYFVISKLWELLYRQRNKIFIHIQWSYLPFAIHFQCYAHMGVNIEFFTINHCNINKKWSHRFGINYLMRSSLNLHQTLYLQTLTCKQNGNA